MVYIHVSTANHLVARVYYILSKPTTYNRVTAIIRNNLH